MNFDINRDESNGRISTVIEIIVTAENGHFKKVR